MPRKRLAALLGLLIGVGAWAQGALPVIELNVGRHRVEAEVAADEASRMLGLMNRPAMAAGHGMLFVFREAGQQCMWMRNTLIPLSVAFVDGDSSIINIEDMQPQTDDIHCAGRPARYALEMNRGWFARHALAAGTRLRGLDKAPHPH